MLLNEFLKAHHKIEERERAVAQLKSGIESLTTTMTQQAALIQGLSDKVELNRSAPQLVENNR